jgi:hypothetical protein
MYHNVLDEPSPLGLRLKKSPSLLDLIQMRLSQASNAGESSMDNSGSEPSKKKDSKSGVSSAGERLKASNFPANILKIGSWEVRDLFLLLFYELWAFDVTSICVRCMFPFLCCLYFFNKGSTAFTLHTKDTMPMNNDALL